MPITIEQYHKYNAAQRKKVKREELQTLLDEHLNTEGNVNSLRGIIREELNANFAQLKSDMTKSIDAKIKTLTDENDKLLEENTVIKAVLAEEQKYLERMRKEETKHNIFMSGIPNALNADMSNIRRNLDDEAVDDHEEIIHHILSFVNTINTINTIKYNKNFVVEC